MFATSCRHSIRPGSVRASLLTQRFACGSPVLVVQRCWGQSASVRQQTLHRRRSCGFCRNASLNDEHDKQQELIAQSEPIVREPYLEVGSIITTHGVRGEVKVQALTDFPEERLLTPGVRWLQAGSTGPIKECYLEGGRGMVSKGRQIWILKLRGCNSLTESEVLRGQTILVSSTDRPELEDENDFLVQDLIDCDVLLQKDNSLIGKVLDMYDGTGPGAHDLLKILLKGTASAASKQQTMLLPFVKEFVPIIDEEKQVIYISPPPGLLELAIVPCSKGKSKKATVKQQSTRNGSVH